MRRHSTIFAITWTAFQITCMGGELPTFTDSLVLDKFELINTSDSNSSLIDWDKGTFGLKKWGYFVYEGSTPIPIYDKTANTVVLKSEHNFSGIACGVDEKAYGELATLKCRFKIEGPSTCPADDSALSIGVVYSVPSHNTDVVTIIVMIYALRGGKIVNPKLEYTWIPSDYFFNDSSRKLFIVEQNIMYELDNHHQADGIIDAIIPVKANFDALKRELQKSPKPKKWHHEANRVSESVSNDIDGTRMIAVLAYADTYPLKKNNKGCEDPIGGKTLSYVRSIMLSRD